MDAGHYCVCEDGRICAIFVVEECGRAVAGGPVFRLCLIKVDHSLGQRRAPGELLMVRWLDHNWGVIYVLHTMVGTCLVGEPPSQ